MINLDFKVIIAQEIGFRYGHPFDIEKPLVLLN